MLDFHTPTLDDKEWVNSCLAHAHSLNCEYTFGNLYVWSEAYETRICRCDDFLICRWGTDDDLMYSLPIGEGDFGDAINSIIDDARSLGIVPCIYGVTDGYLTTMREAFTGQFDYHYDDGYNDYIYSVDKMISLSGKKYHGKRNHISAFRRKHPDWQYEPICSSNMDECIDFHKQWISMRDSNDDDYIQELAAVTKALEHYDELGMVGGLLRADGRVVAYTMGEPMVGQSCFVTHFEKADPTVNGAYAAINNEFSAHCLIDYEYVNREEDLGIDGLRRAKMSYHPELLLRKCVAEYKV